MSPEISKSSQQRSGAGATDHLQEYHFPSILLLPSGIHDIIMVREAAVIENLDDYIRRNQITNTDDQSRLTMEVWQQQIDTLTPNIEKARAADDPKLVTELEEMRDKCVLQCAKKLLEIDYNLTRKQNRNGPPLSFTSLFEKKLEVTIEMARVLERAERVHLDHTEKNGPAHACQVHRGSIRSLASVTTRCEKLMKEWEENVKNGFDEMEYELAYL